MSLFTLVWSYLKARPLNTAINIVLLSLGIAVITILLLFNTQLEQKITDNARGIDLVVGAKGSPLQLILCNIFHVDFPTGNIKLKEADKIARNRLVKRAIPLALGDSYQSYRIVGTSREYADLYKAELARGAWWQLPLEVTLGANVQRLTQLKLGDTFASSHGLTETGSDHADHRYVVKGVLKPTNTVLDNVILTAVESVWEVHEHAEENEHTHQATTDSTVMHSRLVPSVAANDSLKEITSLLLTYRSPMGAIQLPRFVNAQSSLQAASPAFETARLFSILGVGADIIMAFAYVLIVISGLSIFIALYNSLKERRYDMAIMRSMGATRTKLLVSVLLEGGVLTLLGSLVGVLMGHGVLILLSRLVEETQKAGISGMIFYSQEWVILGGSLLLGLLCALIPAIQAYRTDISKVLASQ
ncbi:ABC transporter permease [Chryseolinea lacunae]|uniref:FtsX-like permease family protein n=1 Tax=Chryseolinea lacunae TaxID=2801331 RepID=A0ABS1L0E7_9BACT|nr:FtsX-like permease family protein [Chryseolinea lacunae]MBL0744983.1 FtsX-like permease family protein [Chryseolinea lacunae]